METCIVIELDSHRYSALRAIAVHLGIPAETLLEAGIDTIVNELLRRWNRDDLDAHVCAFSVEAALR